MPDTTRRLPYPILPWREDSARACSTICAADSCARRPRRPVRQNWQFMPQPTWLLTHSVVRGLAPPLRTIGMRTASTAAPAPSPSCRLDEGFNLVLSSSSSYNLRRSRPSYSRTKWFAARRRCAQPGMSIASMAAPAPSPPRPGSFQGLLHELGSPAPGT